MARWSENTFRGVESIFELFPVNRGQSKRLRSLIASSFSGDYSGLSMEKSATVWDSTAGSFSNAMGKISREYGIGFKN